MLAKEIVDQDLRNQIDEIVEDCMGDAPPFCESTCPLHIDVQAYVTAIGEGEYKKAIEIIRDTTPFPGILGRICAHPCEDECKRNEVESALSIKNLKRFASDIADDPEDWDLSVGDDTGKSVAIIGSGPAGATAAYDLRKKGHQATIYEALPGVGGMLRTGIPSYRLPYDVIDEEYSILEKLGVEIKLNTRVGEDISFAKLEEDYDAVFAAVGKQDSIILPIDGSDLDGVLAATDFLRNASFESREVEVEAGDKVVVIGGGNVAIDAARTAWRLGAEEVSLTCLERDFSEMPAHLWEIEDAVEEEIKMYSGWGPMKIEGEDKVEGISLKKCNEVFDGDGNFNPKYDVCELKEIEADKVIFAIGQTTDDSFVEDDSDLEEYNELTLQSSKEHVFVGGDCAGTVLAVEAMAHGRKVATSIDRYFKGADIEKNREYEGSYETWLEKELADDEPIRRRIDMPMIDVEARRNNFKEVELGFDKSEARGEAERCLECECKNCMKECEMLGDFCMSPKDLFMDIKEDEVSPLVFYSCNMCSQCTIVCPHEFKLKDSFMAIRNAIVENNDGESPMKGHGAIKWHQRLGFSNFFTTTIPAKDEEAK